MHNVWVCVCLSDVYCWAIVDPQEADRLRREKQELHAQFAREIEAAHAQLSQRESELGAEHLSALQQLKEDHAHSM